MNNGKGIESIPWVLSWIAQAASGIGRLHWAALRDKTGAPVPPDGRMHLEKLHHIDLLLPSYHKSLDSQPSLPPPQILLFAY